MNIKWHLEATTGELLEQSKEMASRLLFNSHAFRQTLDEIAACNQLVSTAYLGLTIK